MVFRTHLYCPYSTVEDRVQCCVEKRVLELRQLSPEIPTVATTLQTTPVSIDSGWKMIQNDHSVIPPLTPNQADLSGYYSAITEVDKIDPSPPLNPPNQIAENSRYTYTQRGILDPDYPIPAKNPNGDDVLPMSTFNGGDDGGNEGDIDSKGGGLAGFRAHGGPAFTLKDGAPQIWGVLECSGC